jgi:predicted ABC-type ATPase
LLCRTSQLPSLSSLSPNVYIVAGPNGAGKTTFAREFLPNYADCRNFINADLIAQGISPFSPESAAYRAGKLVLGEIDRFARRRDDFGFETTLSGRSYLRLLRELKDAGYQVSIFFLWLPTAELALSRIRHRVCVGGHDVPELDVRRRFDRSIKNFLTNYRHLADEWILFDNLSVPPLVIASQKNAELKVINPYAYNNLTQAYGQDE